MKKELNPDGCRLLARMIVECAGRDYVSALRAQITHPHDLAAQGRVAALENFFDSSWFEMLVPYDGRWLRNDIKKRVLDGCSLYGRRFYESN